MTTNTNLIVLTADTDCDGTSFGAYRVVVPMTMALCRDPNTVATHAILSEQFGNMADAYHVMSTQEFQRTYPHADLDDGFWVPSGTHLGPESWRDGFPYTSSHMRPNWNPWVEDNTLETVLDHTNEDHTAFDLHGDMVWEHMQNGTW
jgi:hypothetical protein